MVKTLRLFSLLCSLALISEAIAIDEPAQSSEETAQSAQERDPIKKLQKAYALQRKSANTKQPQKPTALAPGDEDNTSSTPAWQNRLSSFAQTYASDVVTGYGMNLFHTKFIQQAHVDHSALIKGALFSALRIPDVLDTVYRIPFKMGLYALDDEHKPSEEYLIARTFVEDAVVDYAVNFTYQAGILRDTVDHRRLLLGSLISACRLPFIADCTARFLCNSFIQS